MSHKSWRDKYNPRWPFPTMNIKATDRFERLDFPLPEFDPVPLSLAETVALCPESWDEIRRLMGITRKSMHPVIIASEGKLSHAERSQLQQLLAIPMPLEIVGPPEMFRPHLSVIRSPEGNFQLTVRDEVHTWTIYLHINHDGICGLFGELHSPCPGSTTIRINLDEGNCWSLVRRFLEPVGHGCYQHVRRAT